MKKVLPIVLCACVLAGCGPTKVLPTGNGDNNTPKGETKSVEVKKASDSALVLLKKTDVKGVALFTLSDLDSKQLSTYDKLQLDALAREIKSLGEVEVLVVGHSDNIGSSEVNLSVSRQRAHLVAEYLKKQGIANVSTQGQSYNYPVAGNDTAAGRAKNRRAEVFVSTVGKYNPY